MNKGINVIKKDTTWIWFLNSGDEALSAPSELALSTKLEVIIGGWYGKKNKSRLMIPSKDKGLTMSRRSMIGHGICHQAMLFKYKNYDRRVFRWEKYKYAAELDYYIDAILQGGYLVDNCFRCRYDNSKGLSQTNAIKHLKEQFQIFSQRGIQESRYMKAKCIAKLRVRQIINNLKSKQEESNY